MVDSISSTNKISVKQYEREYWKNKNEKCLKCVKLCKQSLKAKVISCLNYEEKKQG